MNIQIQSNAALFGHYKNGIEVKAASFEIPPHYLGWGPSIFLDRFYGSDFDNRYGWEFSRIEGDILVMTQKGIEYRFEMAKT